MRRGAPETTDHARGDGVRNRRVVAFRTGRRRERSRGRRRRARIARRGDWGERVDEIAKRRNNRRFVQRIVVRRVVGDLGGGVESRGGRFAIGTAGGVVSTWRADGALGPRATPAATRAPTEGDARVEALEFLSPSVVAAAGSKLAGAGDSLALWDTLAPPTSPPAGALAAHEGGATAMCVLPGTTLGGSPWPMLATAGRSGDLAALDLRMLGGDGAAAVVWRAGRDAHGHAAAVKSLAVMRPPAERRRVDGVGSVLVSGCKDGDVRAWSARAGRHLQHVRAAHERHTFIAPRGGGKKRVAGGGIQDRRARGWGAHVRRRRHGETFRLAPDAFRPPRESRGAKGKKGTGAGGGGNSVYERAHAEPSRRLVFRTVAPRAHRPFARRVASSLAHRPFARSTSLARLVVFLVRRTLRV